MQVVIDIPEDIYRRLKDGDNNGSTNAGNTFHNTALESIGNGVILPKGHGRLIDADKYRHEGVDTFDSCYGDKCSILLKMSVDNAPTVIEADK